MASANHKSILAEQIAEILGTGGTASDTQRNARSRSSVRKSIACGSIMLLAINPGQAGAVGLGDIHLKSQLGQPLAATVPLTLQKGESLPRNCAQPARTDNTLSSLPGLRVTSPEVSGPGTYNIRVTTANPLHEPMYELSLMINCPGAALLVRQYVLMLDLPGMPLAASAPARGISNAVPMTPRVDAKRNPGPATRRVPGAADRTLPPRADSIAAGSTYRVSSRDTLSTIASRVDGRLANTTWQVADQIFADNPAAFIRNDPNMIKLGSVIRIPDVPTLASMSPGARGSAAPVTAAREPAATTPDVSATAPNGPPVAVVGNEKSAARRASNTMTETEANRWPAPELPAVANTGQRREAPPAIATSPAATTAPAVTSTSYPFADERPTPTVTGDAGAPGDAAVTTAPRASATAAAGDRQETSQANAVLSVLFGLLIGAAVALLVLRGRLLSALGVGRRTRRVVGERVAIAGREALQKAGTFDESMAAKAFNFNRPDGEFGGANPLPISGPVEDTYIVETSAAEPTVHEDINSLRTKALDSDADANPPAAAQTNPLDDEDSAELAKLFDDDFATDASATGLTAGIEPTAEMPRHAGGPLEPTAELPLQTEAELEPTAAMPQRVDDEIFEPTAELPRDALDDVFDPTGGIDGEIGNELDPTLQQAFDERLEQLDPDEMFATANQGIDELAGQPGVDPDDVTINDPVAQPMLDDATGAADLAGLPDDDDNLSESLHEALALLERDYEDEFTASQILERSQLEKSLREDSEQQATGRARDKKTRKIS